MIRKSEAAQHLFLCSLFQSDDNFHLVINAPDISATLLVYKKRSSGTKWYPMSAHLFCSPSRGHQGIEDEDFAHDE